MCGGHARHPAGEGSAAVVEYVSAAHRVQIPLPLPALYVPAAQGAHALPSMPTYLLCGLEARGEVWCLGFRVQSPGFRAQGST